VAKIPVNVPLRERSLLLASALLVPSPSDTEVFGACPVSVRGSLVGPKKTPKRPIAVTISERIDDTERTNRGSMGPFAHQVHATDKIAAAAA
jgi:hypothetical protein